MAFIHTRMKCLHWYGQPSPFAVAQPCPLDIFQIQLLYGPPSHSSTLTAETRNLVGLRQVEPTWYLEGRGTSSGWCLQRPNLLGHRCPDLWPKSLRDTNVQSVRDRGRVERAREEPFGRLNPFLGRAKTLVRSKPLSH